MMVTTQIFSLLRQDLIKKSLKNYTWHADWKEATTRGLRYSRGMNFGLSMLSKEKKYKEYDFFS